ncbi:MAG: XrtA/PEP-CTERM system amidotransferase [Halofilum sp. (in: g-proteobacteria)]|nr:XrtA/PEP-CTERM system amidotransferase [Halofilum sp. (in: g-proteobacteria)]
MCGIAGVFDTRGQREIPPSLIERMNTVQYHRGPDDGGVHVEPGLGLGHRRLAIIDLSPAGHQPFFNDAGDVGVVYNGEIYNFRELRTELEGLGYRFRSNCDTEVIVHGWSAWGEACVDRFRGMFAFGLWDREQQTLFLARDRLGIKPLYYALLPDGTLLFASELKALAEHPDLPREIDPCAVEDYFAFGYVPDPRSIFRHVRKLRPGHRLSVRRGEPVPESEAYWSLRFPDDHHAGDVDALGEELIARLREAVEIRKIADVPLGAFLSGGVDSSAVVAMMAQAGGDPVKTSSISFGQPEFNESAWAEQVARRYGTDHEVREVSPDDFSLIDRLAGLYDEPFADSSAIPTYRVCELARSGVTVALSGDGGDEGFGGYRRYRWFVQEQRVRRLLPRALRAPVFGAAGRLYPKLNRAPRFLRAKATLQSLALDPLEGYLDSVAVVKTPLRERLYSREFQRELQGYHAVEVLRAHAANGPEDPLLQAQHLDFHTYLPGDILTKVDRASMAHSLEVRVPVLDHHLMEWAAGLPPGLKLHRGEGKYLFKRALRPYLPDDILYRRKMGFAVPLAHWFRGPLAQRLRDELLAPELLDSGLFDADSIRHLIDQHQAGDWDHSAPLWALYMYAGFQRRLLGAS